MRNSLFFNKRPNSLLKMWAGIRKPRKPSSKVTNKLFDHRSETMEGKKIRK